VQLTDESGNAPAIAWTGTEFGIAWGAPPLSNSRAWNDSGWNLAWVDGRDGDFQVYFALLTAGGAKASSDIQLTSSAIDASVPSLLWTGSELALVWGDAELPGSSSIYFTRLDTTGNRLASDVVLATDNASIRDLPVLADTGAGYGLSWHDSRDGNVEVYFARLAVDGTRVGPEIRLTMADSASYFQRLNP